jgi:sugar/nucleoside kinase (ribokinase family)
MQKIMTVGGAMLDTFVEYNNVETLEIPVQEKNVSYVLMQAGKKVEVKDLMYHCGGGAVNSAISFSKMGFDVEAFFKIADDQAGEFIINMLHSYNIKTNNVIISPQGSTGHSFILPHPQGNRPLLAYRGVNLLLQKEELPQESIAQVDQLYITSLSGNASSVLTSLVNLAKKYNKRVAVNPGTSQLSSNVQLLRSALSFIDILVLNSYEAQLLMGSVITNIIEKTNVPHLLHHPMGKLSNCFSLFNFFLDIHSQGPSIIVVTNGAEGVYVSNGTTIFFHPSIKTKAVSTVGAGDAFSSTFVSYLLYNHTIEDALRAGVINSASVVSYVGAQGGLLNKEQLDNKLFSSDKNAIQRYSLVNH